jgi:hypothetical protein
MLQTRVGAATKASLHRRESIGSFLGESRNLNKFSPDADVTRHRLDRVTNVDRSVRRQSPVTWLRGWRRKKERRRRTPTDAAHDRTFPSTCDAVERLWDASGMVSSFAWIKRGLAFLK